MLSGNNNQTNLDQERDGFHVIIGAIQNCLESIEHNPPYSEKTAEIKNVIRDSNRTNILDNYSYKELLICNKELIDYVMANETNIFNQIPYSNTINNLPPTTRAVVDDDFI